jgi:2'-5' RNA ligase
MRLFVAVTPPAPVLAAVAEAATAARAAAAEEHEDLRWVDPACWHITLAFLGEVPDRRLAPLRARLDRVARRYRPLSVSLAGADAFRGRLLWLGVVGERDRLRRLAWSVAAAARREGVEVPDRPFHPHLTLARARGRDRSCPPQLGAALADFAGEPWLIERISLIRSHLVPSHLGLGPRYEPVGDWPLSGKR